MTISLEDIKFLVEKFGAKKQFIPDLRRGPAKHNASIAENCLYGLATHLWRNFEKEKIEDTESKNNWDNHKTQCVNYNINSRLILHN